MKEFVLVCFIITYVLLLTFPRYRWMIAASVAIMLIAIQIVPIDTLLDAIDFNVLLLITGSMGIVALFIESKMPLLLADHILRHTSNAKWAIISMALFAGIISAFIDNVATVLMIAPIALSVAKKLKVNPVPFVIAIAVSSNLQGAATLVGDTTSILLGGYAKMNFLDFFFFHGKPSIFWFVQAGALTSLVVLMVLFKKYDQKVTFDHIQKVEDYFPSILLLLMIGSLILASVLRIDFEYTNGTICMVVLLIGLIRNMIAKKRIKSIMSTLKEIDHHTILLLGSLFVIIAAITNVGIIDDISLILERWTKDDPFMAFTLIVWSSVVISAFIDNIPYVATMLPVVSMLSVKMGIDPTLLYFGLLTGATLGGNLSPIGASANIAGIGILKKQGFHVTLKDFATIGIPFTLMAVSTSYILIWLIWS